MGKFLEGVIKPRPHARQPSSRCSPDGVWCPRAPSCGHPMEVNRAIGVPHTFRSQPAVVRVRRTGYPRTGGGRPLLAAWDRVVSRSTAGASETHIWISALSLCFPASHSGLLSLCEMRLFHESVAWSSPLFVCRSAAFAIVQGCQASLSCLPPPDSQAGFCPQTLPLAPCSATPPPENHRPPLSLWNGAQAPRPAVCPQTPHA